MAEILLKGGEALDKKLSEIAKRLTKAGTLRVGFLEGNGKHSNSDLPYAAIAAIQEFGAPNAGIPPRPFFRPMIAEHQGEWGDILAVQLKRTDYDAEASLDLLGYKMDSELAQSMTDVTSPALSPITLMLRKMKSEDQTLIVTGKTVGEAAARVAAGESTSGVSTKPLIETGELQGAIAHEVNT